MTESKIRVPISVPSISDLDVATVSAAVSSGWISGRGKNILDFEEEFSKWLGVKNTMSCSSGTSALHLALVSLGIKPGDEVVIPAFSMCAIAFAVSYTGAKIVLLDSENETWNLDPNQLKEKLTRRTKAIIVMHTYGHPANLDPIMELCNKEGISVIEDAAEAHGAEYKGRKVGTFGKIGCFSFFSNKIITTGEGGAVVTSDPEIADRVRILRDMAFSKNPAKKFLHEYVGYNYRMTNMQAGLGKAQLTRIESFIAIRRKNAKSYTELLNRTLGIVTPPEAVWAKNVFWMYSILITPRFGMTRDALMTRLSNLGIETRPFFVTVNRQPVYSSEFLGEEYPAAELLSQQGLNLPSGNTLTEDQVQYVASSISSLQR